MKKEVILLAASKDNPPPGHILLTIIAGMSVDEVAFLQSCNVTHGMPLEGNLTGMFEVSRFNEGERGDPYWALFRGRGNKTDGWRVA